MGLNGRDQLSGPLQYIMVAPVMNPGEIADGLADGDAEDSLHFPVHLWLPGGSYWMSQVEVGVAHGSRKNPQVAVGKDSNPQSGLFANFPGCGLSSAFTVGNAAFREHELPIELVRGDDEINVV